MDMPIQVITAITPMGLATTGTMARIIIITAQAFTAASASMTSMISIITDSATGLIGGVSRVVDFTVEVEDSEDMERLPMVAARVEDLRGEAGDMEDTEATDSINFTALDVVLCDNGCASH